MVKERYIPQAHFCLRTVYIYIYTGLTCPFLVKQVFFVDDILDQLTVLNGFPCLVIWFGNRIRVDVLHSRKSESSLLYLPRPRCVSLVPRFEDD